MNTNTFTIRHPLLPTLAGFFIFFIISAVAHSALAPIPAVDTTLYNRLKGSIILTVEQKGEAYYIHPSKQELYYLGRPNDAFETMRIQGVGISNAQINKIPLGLDIVRGKDADTDGLPDLFEDGIGTDKNKKDTDGDGFDDKAEIASNFDPRVANKKLVIDLAFSTKQKGKILLQVEQNGEAWYVSPKNGKRYFLGRPADAFDVMRFLGIGISDANFTQLTSASSQTTLDLSDQEISDEMSLFTTDTAELDFFDNDSSLDDLDALLGGI